MDEFWPVVAATDVRRAPLSAVRVAGAGVGLANKPQPLHSKPEAL